MRSIIFVGISFKATKLLNCDIGTSSTYIPMRLPSKPRSEMREALPKPPVFRTVTPTVRASTSLIFVAVPCNCRCPITDIGIADSFNFLISLRAVTITSFISTVVSRLFTSCAFPLSMKKHEKSIRQIAFLYNEQVLYTPVQISIFLLFFI